MTSFQDRVRQYNTGDANTTTKAVLESYNLPEEAYKELFPVIEDRVRAFLRDLTKTLEKRPRFTKGALRRVSLRGSQTAVLEDFRLLTVRMFDGRSLRWGEMTIEDHESRINHLEQQVSGISSTIDRHKWAIDQIRQHNVKTLDDIPGESLR